MRSCLSVLSFVWPHIFSQPYTFDLECFHETLKVTLRQKVPVFPKFPLSCSPSFSHSLSLAFLWGKTLLQFRPIFHHTGEREFMTGIPCYESGVRKIPPSSPWFTCFAPTTLMWFKRMHLTLSLTEPCLTFSQLRMVGEGIWLCGGRDACSCRQRHVPWSKPWGEEKSSRNYHRYTVHLPRLGELSLTQYGDADFCLHRSLAWGLSDPGNIRCL